MTTELVDRAAGVAAFRQGRSLCIRLRGPLDPAAARAVAGLIHGGGDAVRLRLECSALSALEPTAARTMAHALLAWARRGADRSVEILNLDARLRRQLAWHPLRAFVGPDELLFLDPDREGLTGLAPSRH